MSRAAAARFFIRVEQVGAQWQDRNTLPLFPLLLVMEPEMLEADAAYEAARFSPPREKDASKASACAEFRDDNVLEKA